MTDANATARLPEKASEQPVALPGSTARWAGRWTSPRLALIAVLVCLFLFLAVRLGPALLGFKVFAGVDLLTASSPWNTGAGGRPPMIPFIGDNLDAVFPGYLEMHTRLFSGDFPLWSGLGGAGTQLMASPSLPTLTPASVWLVLLPTSWSLGFTKLVEVLLAFAGMTLWLRRLGTKWAAGGTAGLLYVGSGFMTSWANWTAQASVACLIPALFWAVERFLQIRSPRSALPIAAVVAFLLLSGFPAAAGHALYAGSAYFLVRLFNGRRSHGNRSTAITAGTGVAAVLLGVGLSAVQLLPQLRALSGTDLAYRDSQFNYQQPLTSFLSLFYPRTFNPHGYVPSNPIEAYAFVGFGALALAVLAVLAGRWSVAPRGVTTMLVVTFALSAAVVWFHGFWTDWLRHVPIFSGNSSGRLRDLVALSGCALGGIGFDLLFRRDLPGIVRRRLVVGSWALFGVGALFTVAIGSHYQSVISTATLVQDAALGLGVVALVAIAFLVLQPASAVRAVATSSTGSSEFAAAGATPTHGRSASVGAGAGSASSGRWRGGVLSGVVVAAVALIAVQAGTSVAYFWPLSSEKNFYPRTPAIAAIQAQVGSGRAVQLNSFAGSSAAAYGIRTLTGHSFQPDAWKDLVLSVDPAAYGAAPTAFGAGRSATNPVIGLPLTSPALGAGGSVLDRMAVNTIVAAPGFGLPGPLLLANSQPDPAPGASLGPDRVPVGTGRTIGNLALSAQKVRGIQIQLAAAIGRASSSVTLTATIADATGRVRATGQVTRPGYAAKVLQIPVAGEKLDSVPGPLRLTLGVSEPSGPPRTIYLRGAGATPGFRIVGGQPDGLTEQYADSTIDVWSRITALPRIRWASAAITVPAKAARLAAMASPATPDDTVILSKDGPSPAGGDAKLTKLEDSGDEVDVDVDASGSGYLVLADSIQTGWQVRVNGNDHDIVDADHAFGAVFVQSGHSRVEFSYVGEGVKTGAAITAAGLAIVAAVLVSTAYLRRRRRSVG